MDCDLRPGRCEPQIAVWVLFPSPPGRVRQAQRSASGMDLLGADISKDLIREETDKSSWRALSLFPTTHPTRKGWIF